MTCFKNLSTSYSRKALKIIHIGDLIAPKALLNIYSPFGIAKEHSQALRAPQYDIHLLLVNLPFQNEMIEDQQPYFYTPVLLYLSFPYPFDFDLSYGFET